MPLTKIQYDMLADDAKSQINQQVELAGVGSPLVFAATDSDTVETMTGFKIDGVTKTVRNTEFVNGKLVVTLASFSPNLSASGQSLSWDVPASAFSVTVDNPTDFPSQYINGVASITQTSGSVYGTLSGYSAGSKTNTPAGGVDWSQTFSTNSTAKIKPVVSSGSTGGSASADLAFTYNDGSSSQSYTTETKSISFNWDDVSHGISIDGLSGKTFLETYTSAGYSPSVGGISNGNNKVYDITGTNGTPTSATASGTLNFTVPIHKTNASATTTKVTLSTTCNRPASVTGTSYSTVLGPTASTSINTGASFSYPTFAAWTASTATKPTRAQCIDGSAFDETFVELMGDQVKTFAGVINNSDTNPRAYWFAVRASASQPSTFKTGASAGLLGDYPVTDGGTVALQPDTPPAGYSAENYRLWGITLQAGNTYVSIS